MSYGNNCANCKKLFSTTKALDRHKKTTFSKIFSAVVVLIEISKDYCLSDQIPQTKWFPVLIKVTVLVILRTFILDTWVMSI